MEDPDFDALGASTTPSFLVSQGASFFDDSVKPLGAETETDPGASSTVREEGESAGALKLQALQSLLRKGKASRTNTPLTHG